MRDLTNQNPDYKISPPGTFLSYYFHFSLLRKTSLIVLIGDTNGRPRPLATLVRVQEPLRYIPLGFHQVNSQARRDSQLPGAYRAGIRSFTSPSISVW